MEEAHAGDEARDQGGHPILRRQGGGTQLVALSPKQSTCPVGGARSDDIKYYVVYYSAICAVSRVVKDLVFM